MAAAAVSANADLEARETPVKEDCTSSQCHGAIPKAPQAPHSPLVERGCGSCHEGEVDVHPEGEGDEFRLAGGKGGAHCLSCHAALEERIAEAVSVHAAVKQGLCTSCHDPHGSGFSMLLKRKVISNPAMPPYYSNISELCWNCHPRELVLEVETESATAFRDGRRNLHAVHTSERKGRSCKACHDFHASNQELILRPFVPVGTAGWVLPIEFTRTKDGGRCVVGCHREATYRR